MYVAVREGRGDNVLTELQDYGVKDVLVACVDGLKGFPDAMIAVYPVHIFSLVTGIRL